LSSVATLLFALTAVRAQSGLYGQCGGIGYTGPTTCSSGVCTYSNAYYSQCLPGASTTSNPPKPTSTTPTTTSSGPVKTGNPVTTFFGGVNLAGFDFTVFTDGSFGGPLGIPPPLSQISHFTSEGVNIFRVPTAWQLATPQVGGPLNATWFSQYNNVVQTALNAGAHVIIDIHNYARWNGQLIGESGGPTNAQFANLWSQIATKYKSQPNVIFGLMNEPHDLISIAHWTASVQAAVTAIRAAGATSQLILIPGSSYSSAQTLPTEAGPSLLTVVDSDGTKNKLIFDVHKYLDSDNSGTHPDCVTDNTSVLQNLVNWLKQNNRQALLSETGGGNTQSCEMYLKTELAFVKANSRYIIGFSVWSAGSFDTTYTLTVTPNSNGSDQPLWQQAVRPNLP